MSKVFKSLIIIIIIVLLSPLLFPEKAPTSGIDLSTPSTALDFLFTHKNCLQPLVMKRVTTSTLDFDLVEGKQDVNWLL